MADEILWYVRYTDGKWEVEEVEDLTDDEWIKGTNAKGCLEVFGCVRATCENEATVKACSALMDIFSAANRAPLPVCFD